ncbi:MAG TPA: hypothetical protein DD789_06180 [Firmicutes bacterium]|nr:hypothetical protein [Bacillota bacterium]
MEIDLCQIYTCPRCRMETPHYLQVRREERVAISCSRCQTTSLLEAAELENHQAWWEAELEQILSGLEENGRDDEH